MPEGQSRIPASELKPYEQHIYQVARDQANAFSRFYLNIRVASFSFTLVSVGAISVFGWNGGFQYDFMMTTKEEKYLRFVVILLLCVMMISSIWFEVALSKRYRVAWKEALKYELMLEGIGLHSLIQSARSGLRYPARISFSILMAILAIVTLAELPRFGTWWYPDQYQQWVTWFTHFIQ